LTHNPISPILPPSKSEFSSFDSILYSEIAPKLREIEVNTNRVEVDVIGQSAGGSKWQMGSGLGLSQNDISRANPTLVFSRSKGGTMKRDFLKVPKVSLQMDHCILL